MSSWKNLKNDLGLTALDYPVPSHANTFWYSLGGMTLFSFVVTLITGAVLTQFYNPAPAVAHASVRYISMTPGLGLIRALHHWSANLGFILLIAHMLRVMFTGAYRTPRIVTYLVGVVLLFIAFQVFFTGTVLKWDQEGYEALAHFVAANKLLGPLGAIFQEDFTLSTSMLARIFGLHVAILPALLIILIVLHVFYVKHFGVAPKPYQNDADYQTSLGSGATFTKHLWRLSIYSLIILIILIGLAYLFPPGLLEVPKPGVEMTKPPWLFWIFYPIESALGIVGILLGSVVVFIGLIFIPILGLIIGEERTLFRVVNVIVVVGFIAWLAMLIITYFSPTMQHL
jgi:quinol-cytochrome oxidoreductase complex cytochrome b subunit